MYFPISDVYIEVWQLLAIGFAVGVCGGFWGMGGGWIVTPALYALGLPMPLAVGTDLAHIVGKSIVATFRHFEFGNVSLRVALLMLPGTMVGTEIGARLVERLQCYGEAYCNSVLTAAYAVLLGGLAAFTFAESLRSKEALDREDREGPGTTSQRSGRTEDRVSWDIAGWVQSIRIPPEIELPLANIPSISVWVILFLGLLTGFLAGALGVGGGFLRMPGLVYTIGLPTHVAVGTDLFEIIVSGAWGGFTHALKGNVDVMIALWMLIGAALGAQIGTFATRYVQGTQIRLLVGVGMLFSVTALVLKTYLGMPDVALALVLTMAGGMALLIIGYLIVGMLRPSDAEVQEEMKAEKWAERRDGPES